MPRSFSLLCPRALDEGLITVSIKHADRKDLRSIAKESAVLIEKARTGGLKVDDVTGNSITLSSLGGFDIDCFTPIVNLPEAAILGVGSVVERPVVKAGKIEIAPIMKLSLSFDHRIVDGAPAARFLQLLKRKLEDQPLPEPGPDALPPHENVRGSAYFN